MSVELRPCTRLGSKLIAFLVNEDKEFAHVLDNYVWAVAVKKVPINEFRKEWTLIVLPEDKMKKILDGLAGYAIYAGMTPEAAEYLPKMVPMTKKAQEVALAAGVATLERHKTQAAAEEAADKGKRPLNGAALKSVVDKKMRSVQDNAEELVEPGTSTNATEAGVVADKVGPDKPKLPPPSVTERRRTSKRAQRAKEVAAELTADLTKVEEAGGNPVEALKKTAPVAKVIKKTEKAEKAERTAKGFDVAKLKGVDGEYKSVSAMLKGLILENEGKKKPLTDDEIFEKVKAKFGLDDSKRGYVKWNRNWLKTNGVL